MDEFVDKKGRLIDVEVDENIIALHEGREIARFEFAEIPMDKAPAYIRLELMTMDKEYEKAGIGFELMKKAICVFGHFEIPNLSNMGLDGAESNEYFTEDGAAFLRICWERDILPESFAKFFN